MSNVISLHEVKQNQELQACHMSLYPTKDSLVEALEYIEAQQPYTAADLFPLLMTYHNSLIKALADGT